MVLKGMEKKYIYIYKVRVKETTTKFIEASGYSFLKDPSCYKVGKQRLTDSSFFFPFFSFLFLCIFSLVSSQEYFTPCVLSSLLFLSMLFLSSYFLSPSCILFPPPPPPLSKCVLFQCPLPPSHVLSSCLSPCSIHSHIHLT